MTDKLFESFSALDDDLIERSFEKRSGRRKIFPLAALAACLAAAFLAAVPGMRTKNGHASGAGGNFFAMDADQETDANASVWTDGGDLGIQAATGAAPDAGAATDAPGAVFPGASSDSAETTTNDVAVDESAAGKPPEGDIGGSVPAFPSGDGLDTPPDTGGPTDPMSPPELTFNLARALPELPSPTGSDRSTAPLTAKRLAEVWSADCPAALMEPGESDTWDHGVNLSGEAVYNGGEFEKLTLTFREKDNPVTAVADVTVSDSLDPVCASIPENADPVLSWRGSLKCLAYRCDGLEDTLFGAVFLIGPVRWEVRAHATPGQEQDAQSIVTRFCVSYEYNAMNGIFPDLGEFADPES